MSKTYFKRLCHSQDLISHSVHPLTTPAFKWHHQYYELRNLINLCKTYFSRPFRGGVDNAKEEETAERLTTGADGFNTCSLVLFVRLSLAMGTLSSYIVLAGWRRQRQRREFNGATRGRPRKTPLESSVHSLYNNANEFRNGVSLTPLCN